MSEEYKIKPRDPLGDKFIEMMEAQGLTFVDCSLSKSDAKAGGDIAGGAKQKLEKRLGRSIVSKKNYLKDKNKELES